jgi:LPS sulfotransferase NodH
VSLEDALKDINGLLSSVGNDVINRFEKNKYPIIFIMGNPRSGSTLLLQWLASLGVFAYPTNLLSRFYEAPCVGAKIQKVLIDYDFKGEIFDPSYGKTFYSDLGKTTGPNAPHEFWYFWRRFFKYGEIQKLDTKSKNNIDVRRLRSEIGCLENEFQKPLVFKGMMFNWDISLINKIFDKVLFINLTREPIYNMDDLIYARQQFYGDQNKWYSFKPPEYEELKYCNPLEQVAGQVMLTSQAIEKQFEEIEQSKKITYSYEELCDNPRKLYKIICDKLGNQGCKVDKKYSGIELFEKQNNFRILNKKDAEQALNKFL